MKKILASALAASMVMSLSAAAFAATSATITGTSSDGTGDNITLDVSKKNSSGDVTLSVPTDFTDMYSAEYTLQMGGEDLVLYNYGETDEIKIRLDGFSYSSYDPAGTPLYVDKIRVDVTEGAVKVNYKKSEDLITIKPDAGLRDFDEEDFTIDVDVELDDDQPGRDFTFYIKGQVAYSNVREVSEDENYANRDKDDEGCMYEFNSSIDEQTRIRCNEYVDVYFKGNYGTDKENMRVWTDTISEVEDYFDDVDLDYYDFQATPKFATKVKVVIDGDPNAYVYEYNKSTGDLTKIDAAYESDGWAFTTKTLGCYIVAEEEYEGGNVLKDTTDTDDEEDTDTTTTTDTPVKTNPGTGYSD